MSRTCDDRRRSSVSRRRHGRGLACGRMLLAIALAAVSADTRRAQASEPAPPTPDDAVGVATRGPDGSIVLTLRAEGADGAAGDAQVRYAPADPDHAMIARHVGPIPPGGSVPVRPFPARRPALYPMRRPVPEVR